MNRINCVSTKYGLFDLSERHTKDFKNYWINIYDQEGNYAGSIMQSLGEFANKRHTDYRYALLRKAIERALQTDYKFDPAYYEWHLTNRKGDVLLNWVDPVDNFFVSEDDDENDVYDELRPMTYEEVLMECECFIEAGDMSFENGDKDYHGVSRKMWDKLPRGTAEIIAKRMFFYYCLELSEIVES